VDQLTLLQAQEKTLSIVMGGGAGTRLFPLTQNRSKPAVPLGGKYRLVDIPISNCINSGFFQIYVLTQFNSVSLHRHIQSAYRFDHFRKNFVEILAAQQTPGHSTWYQGTADAVRQNLRYFLRDDYDYYLILSGDQLYRMDFREILARHMEHGSDITIATIPVGREAAKSFGIMRTDPSGKITDFVEKPQKDSALSELRMPPSQLERSWLPTTEERYLANMGIYLFNRELLEASLDNDLVDFGKHIIPTAIRKANVNSFIFQGYWEDIGTIRSFYEANLDLAKIVPAYDFFDAQRPIFTNPRFLPASKINAARIDQAIISDGCIITDASIVRSVIGVRSIIESKTEIVDTVVMGADYFERNRSAGDPSRDVTPIGIGSNCRIRCAIIDKNARIGNNVVIDPAGKPADFDGDQYFIRDGVVVIPKNAVIATGTRI
jgi:glucose-1-phosphate adenylyltransferase